MFAFLQSSRCAAHLDYALQIAYLPEIDIYKDRLIKYGRNMTIWFWLGMRFTYISIILCFGIFGPIWLLIATIGLILVQLIGIDS